jgi:high-affinity iron transporter
MAFVFAGKGVAELQGGGVLPTTIVSWAPRMPGLGIYPTVESLLAQGVLAILLLAALVWTFVIEPRRQRRAPAAPLGSRPSRPAGAALKK